MSIRRNYLATPPLLGKVEVYAKSGHSVMEWIIGRVGAYAGFHCSWCYKPEGIRLKLASAQKDDKPRWGDYPEKLDLGYIAGLIRNGRWFDNSQPFFLVKPEQDRSYAPSYMLEHRNKFSYLLDPPTPDKTGVWCSPALFKLKNGSGRFYDYSSFFYIVQKWNLLYLWSGPLVGMLSLVLLIFFLCVLFYSNRIYSWFFFSGLMVPAAPHYLHTHARAYNITKRPPLLGAYVVLEILPAEHYFQIFFVILFKEECFECFIIASTLFIF